MDIASVIIFFLATALWGRGSWITERQGVGISTGGRISRGGGGSGTPKVAGGGRNREKMKYFATAKARQGRSQQSSEGN